MNIRIIGFGRLAKSLIPHWQDKHIINISSPSLTENTSYPSIKMHSSNLWALDSQDILILAVKPERIATVINELKPSLKPNSLIVSLAAGVTQEQLASWAPKHCKITRAMPNITAEVRGSFTLLRRHESLSEQNCHMIESLFKANGHIYWVDDDKLLDLGTIIAGSGPAYIYFFMRAFQKAAIDLGCSEDLAKEMVLQTFAGATKLALEKDISLDELQHQVTSPKGTTAAAIAIFEKQGLDKTIIAAIEHAWERVLSIRAETKN